MDKHARLVLADLWIRQLALEEILGAVKDSPLGVAVAEREIGLRQTDLTLQRVSEIIELPVQEIREYFQGLPLYFLIDSEIDPEKVVLAETDNQDYA
jgi:hypothetical protein